MTDSKPYLIRALYEWICDNEQTPYVYIDTRLQGLLLPDNLYDENPLILNIAPSACQYLQLGNENITFEARFGGRVFAVVLPVPAILAIVAKENGQGMSFEVHEPDTAETDTADKNDKAQVNRSSAGGKSGLKVIK